MPKYIHTTYPIGFAVVLDEHGEEKVITHGDAEFDRMNARMNESLKNSMIEEGYAE